MDARTQAWVDQQDAHVVDKVRSHGWSIEYVIGDACACAEDPCTCPELPACSNPSCDCVDVEGPAFAYTVGLFGLRHPELLIFGLAPSTTAGVLNAVGEGVRDGDSLIPGQMIEVEGWDRRIVPETVPNPGEILLGANRFYDRPAHASVPALQLTYEDAAGRFPWDEGWASDHLQPRPGTFEA
jgi:hypothetical protein